MPSPFPGMDPYLEAHWRDVHARLTVYAAETLQSVLPPGLKARVEERVVVHDLWLGAEDAQWADGLLRVKGFRGGGSQASQ